MRENYHYWESTVPKRKKGSRPGRKEGRKSRSIIHRKAVGPGAGGSLRRTGKKRKKANRPEVKAPVLSLR